MILISYTKVGDFENFSVLYEYTVFSDFHRQDDFKFLILDCTASKTNDLFMQVDLHHVKGSLSYDVLFLTKQ